MGLIFFANNFNILREQFQYSSRTILIFFAKNFMRFLVDKVQEYKSPSTCIFFFIFDCLWRKYIS